MTASTETAGTTTTDNKVKVTVGADRVITAEKEVTMTQQVAGYADGSATKDVGPVAIATADFKTTKAVITVTSNGAAPTIVIS